MKFILRIFPWKRTIHISIAVIAALIIFSFYGLYTNTFHLFKPNNYIFPLLTLSHITFLYVLWFKIKEDELTDPQMRNIEYILYVVFAVYVFKTFESLYILTSYSDFENHIIPASFFPVGILIFLLHVLLLGLTLLAIKYRRDMVGPYVFDDMNQHIDSWE
ncbi:MULTISPECIES: hypothetical protein [Zobellia]|uniref:hypothetical protein n=1 Tax=Zobellia TaxID=112040 RepID=UPI001BFF9F51|nr:MULTISPECIES: hypothetical protein [Zobellia]MBT9189142.1 hypothetical protein [Zobellia russellii]MDO6820321.1 hypothetical protein [Zobellia sp. 1_MG-2023]